MFINKNAANAVLSEAKYSASCNMATDHCWSGSNQSVVYKIPGFEQEIPSRFAGISIGNSPGLFFPDFDQNKVLAPTRK